MLRLRRRINIGTFVITLRQIANHLKTNPQRIINWEKWEHVLWVHLEGRGGYFISYRQVQQWIAACRTLIRACRNLNSLNALWSAIGQESDRYTEEALSFLRSHLAATLHLFVKPPTALERVESRKKARIAGL